MQYSSSYLPKSNKLNATPSKGTGLFNSSHNLMTTVHEYRRIPVVLDGIKVSQVQCENVSRLKELKHHTSRVMKDYIPPSEVTKTVNKNSASTDNQRSNLENFSKKTKQKYSFNNTLSVSKERISVSEPNLLFAKDRGDCTTKKDATHYKECSISEDRFSGHPARASKCTGINGCIYIKNSGKIYKSKILAENIQDKVCSNYSDMFKLLNKNSIENPAHSRLDKRHGEDFTFEDNRLKFINDGLGQFEIAIILSGINNISENISDKQKKLHSRMHRPNNIYNSEKYKKKNTESYIKDKDFESSLRRYPKSFKNTYKYKKEKYSQNACGSKLSLSGTQETNRTYSISEGCSSVSNSDIGDNIRMKEQNNKCTKRVSWKNTSVSSERKENVIRNNSKFSDSSCPGIAPQSGMYAFDENNLLIRPKISEEELWKKFESIFRSYASTTRHSGEVIPRIISTRWMKTAGVVDDFLTKKEAYDAFSKEAGTKITMNALEYKGFLLRLTKRLKLPYYVIYHRMCQVDC